MSPKENGSSAVVVDDLVQVCLQNLLGMHRGLGLACMCEAGYQHVR